MISLELDGELQLLADTAGRFAQEHLRPAARAAERSGDVPDELVARWNALGFAELAVEGGALPAAIVAEALAAGDPGLALALPSPGAFGRLVHLTGGEVSTALRGAVALSERTPRGDDFATRAVRRGDEYIISGRKDFVLGAAGAEAMVVLAQLEEGAGVAGAGLFVVECSDPAVRVLERERGVGLEVLHVASVALTDVAVAAGARLDDGDIVEILDAFFAREALEVAALTVGTATAAYEYALEYAGQRSAFGKPIAHFQAIAFMLADMLMDVEAARLLVRKAAWLHDEGDPEARAAMHSARAQADEAAAAVTSHAVQILGGHGYIQDHPVEKWMRDARALAVLRGSAETSELRAAGALLGGEPDPDGLPLGPIQPVLT